ncbi:glyoxalase superfamily protein [Actinopolymorpha sp. B17G11]|uniref:glyoxalase superfamily protein n=1 Tax=Actinopolymorpha sp. B17G11 TaxID=3160861 RepID=UPI0032E4B71F
MINLLAADDVKAMARRLRTALAADGTTISHSAALELTARQLGARDWNTLVGSLPDAARTDRRKPKPGDPVDAVPIIRIFDVDQAYAFYCDYLGFGRDWEHRFEDHQPMYAQVSRGDVRLHLSEHHGDGSPGIGVLLTTLDVRALHDELQSKDYPLNPAIESEERGLTLAVIDPFHNRLVFHQPVDQPARVDTVAAPWRHRLRVSCSPPVAFEIFTLRMGEWWGPGYNAHPEAYTGVRLEPRVGGAVVFTFDRYPDQSWGRVAAWDPPRVYAQDFWLAQDPDYPSRLTVTFTDDADGTVVDFEHGGWVPGNAAWRNKFAEWPIILRKYIRFADQPA